MAFPARVRCTNRYSPAISTTLSYNTTGQFQTPMDVIQNVIQFGDGNNNRVLFQVWEDRLAWLAADPGDVSLQVRGIEDFNARDTAAAFGKRLPDALAPYASGRDNPNSGYSDSSHNSDA